jgi:hypothetical protein
MKKVFNMNFLCSFDDKNYHEMFNLVDSYNKRFNESLSINDFVNAAISNYIDQIHE